MKHAIISTCLVAFATAADAATFPADGDFVALECDGEPMFDAVRDEAGAIDERDIVGDGGAPAGLRASDDQTLFLRIRLDIDPIPGGAIRPFSWGMEVDLDGDLSTYELLILVDGISGNGQINLFTNDTVTLPNDPTDPADQPPAATVAFAGNARSVPAGSNFNGNPDFFLDVAIPWAALIDLGMDHDSPVFVWVASSSSSNSLNGDFACHDGATGEPVLDDTASDGTAGDPDVDPVIVGGANLEGGGGCAASGGSAFGLVVLVLLALRRRR